jgi:hypothetical protein
MKSHAQRLILQEQDIHQLRREISVEQRGQQQCLPADTARDAHGIAHIPKKAFRAVCCIVTASALYPSKVKKRLIAKKGCCKRAAQHAARKAKGKPQQRKRYASAKLIRKRLGLSKMELSMKSGQNVL